MRNKGGVLERYELSSRINEAFVQRGVAAVGDDGALTGRRCGSGISNDSISCRLMARIAKRGIIFGSRHQLAACRLQHARATAVGNVIIS